MITALTRIGFGEEQMDSASLGLVCLPICNVVCLCVALAPLPPPLMSGECVYLFVAVVWRVTVCVP
jgi:hypothetical protein